MIGIWNLDGEPVDREMLREMGRRISHRGPDGEKIWIEGSFGLLFQWMKVAPSSGDEVHPPALDSQAAAVIDGRIDNRPELLDLLKLSPQSCDASLVLSAYRSYGKDFPRRLNGDFAAAVFDRENRCLVMARDIAGHRPLHYARVKNAFVFASEIKAILAHEDAPLAPNEEMIAESCVNGWGAQREATFFKGIYSVPPGWRLELSPAGMNLGQYWEYALGDRIRFKSFGEYEEAFREVLSQAVRRRVRSSHPVAVAVSGGLDSSAIFCLAETLRMRNAELFPRLIGVSYVPDEKSSAYENEFLVEIENRYGVEIHRRPLAIPENFQWSGGDAWAAEMPTFPWSSIASLMAFSSGQGARSYMTGNMGDQIFVAPHYLLDLVFQFRFKKAWQELREFSRWWANPPGAYRGYKKMLLRESIRHFLPDPLRARLRQINARRRSSRRESLWYSHAIEKRAREIAREAAPLKVPPGSAYSRSIFRAVKSGADARRIEAHSKLAAVHGLEYSTPYLDRDLVSFLLCIPGDILSIHGVSRGLQRKSLRGILPEAIAERKTKGDLTSFLKDWMKEESAALSGELLSDRSMVIHFGYADRSKISEAVAWAGERLAGEKPLTMDLIETIGSFFNLLGLEIWLRTFFGKGNGHEAPQAAYRAS